MMMLLWMAVVSVLGIKVHAPIVQAGILIKTHHILIVGLGCRKILVVVKCVLVELGASLRIASRADHPSLMVRPGWPSLAILVHEYLV
jgi:hypothetical protein